jgi:hypothetical protein
MQAVVDLTFLLRTIDSEAMLNCTLPKNEIKRIMTAFLATKD